MTPGSWWPGWCSWLDAHYGEWIAAPTMTGSKRFPPIEAAPGSYVRETR